MGEIREGMEVCGADGHLIGTVERVEGDAFVADGRRMGADAVERIADGRIYLWGNTVAYDDTDGEATEKKVQSQGLPNPEHGLFVNERPVEESLEDRMGDKPAR